MPLIFSIKTNVLLVFMPFLVVALGLVGCGAEHSPKIADKVDFNYDIRPILVQKCFLCHGPDPNSRKANLDRKSVV